MDDLMEIDFTKKDDDSLSNDSNYDPKHSSCYDLMEIEYPQNANSSGNSAMYGGPSEMGKRKKSASISGTLTVKETARMSQPVPIARRSDGPDSDGYMSMKPVGSSDSKQSASGSLSFQRNSSGTVPNNAYMMSSSPTKYASRPTTIASPGATHRTIPVSRTHQNSIGHDDYLNMSPVNVRSATATAAATTNARSRVSSQSSQQSPLQQLPQQQQQPQMHHVGSGSAPDGYMEMSWNNRTQANNSSQLLSTNNNNNNNNNSLGHVTLERNRQSSSSSISSSNEYINMNFSGNIPRTSSQSSDCSSTGSIELPTHPIESRNSRLRSLPITIKKSTTQQSQPPNNTVISKHSTMNMSSNHPQNHPTAHSFAASKMVPPTFLSLNTNIKPACAQTSQLNSAAAAAASANSDYSLMAPIGDAASHSNTSSAAATIFPFSPNSPNNGVNKQIFSSQSKQNCDDQKRKCLVDGTTGKLKRWHIELNFPKSILITNSFHFDISGTLRLSESESESSTPTASKSTKSTPSSSATTPLVDVLSSDYADMTLGNSKNAMRNTGPTLSPKENIKKLKSSFFGCNKIDENKMDCASGTVRPVAAKPAQPPAAAAVATTSSAKTATNVTTNSKNAKCDEGDYTIMNPILNRRTASSSSSTTQHHTQHHPSSAFATTSGAGTSKPAPASTATKKTALVTSDPDKVMANAQNKTNIDGFKPITSRADKEVFQQHNRSIPTANATTFNRQHSVPSEKLQRKHSSTTSANDNGGYELLELRSSSSSHAMMSSGSGAAGGSNSRIARPNSVNSEKTTFTPLMRPNSANSERQSTSTFSLTSTPLNESGTQSVRKANIFWSIWKSYQKCNIF